MTDKNDRLLTTDEVADYLRLDANSVRAMARQKRIPTIRIGRLWRYRRVDIEQWIKEQERNKEEQE